MTSTTEESVDAYVERLVGSAPELTDEQRQIVSSALGGAR